MGHLVIDTLVTGLPYAPVVLGIYLVFRVRPDFDLTLDASFATGGAVAATLLLAGISVPVAMILGVLAAGSLGLVTASIHMVLRVPVILAGLIMSIGMFSVNLRIMGIPALGLTRATTLFSPLHSLTPLQEDAATIAILFVIAAATGALIAGLLSSELGLALRATGVNVRMARSLGIDDRWLLAANLFLANALAGFSGSLAGQNQGFVTVDAGTGTLIAGLGAVLLGELVVRPGRSRVGLSVFAVIVGSVLYRFILVLSLRVGLAPGDLKGITAATLVVVLALDTLLRGAITGRPRPWLA